MTGVVCQIRDVRSDAGHRVVTTSCGRKVDLARGEGLNAAGLSGWDSDVTCSTCKPTLQTGRMGVVSFT